MAGEWGTPADKILATQFVQAFHQWARSDIGFILGNHLLPCAVCSDLKRVSPFCRTADIYCRARKRASVTVTV